MDPEYKAELIALLKEFKDCFAWEYVRCLAETNPFMNIDYLLNQYIDRSSNIPRKRNLNKTTPMDGYPMLVADGLVNIVAGHKVTSFVDD
jgi:hypothetical protein